MTCPHGFESPHCPRVGCEASRPAPPPIPRTLEATQRAVLQAAASSRDPDGYSGTVHTPEARALHDGIERLAKRDTATGDITHGRGFIGVQEDGRRAEGGVEWHWRPPMPVPVRGHDEMPLQANGLCSGYQPAPPVFVHGAVLGSARDMRRHLRQISEAQAERMLLAQSMAGLGVEELGLSDSQLRRRRRGRSHG